MKRQRNPKLKSVIHLKLCQQSLTILKKEIKKKDENTNQLEKNIENLAEKQKSFLSDIDHLGHTHDENV